MERKTKLSCFSPLINVFALACISSFILKSFRQIFMKFVEQMGSSVIAAVISTQESGGTFHGQTCTQEFKKSN